MNLCIVLLLTQLWTMRSEAATTELYMSLYFVEVFVHVENNMTIFFSIFNSPMTLAQFAIKTNICTHQYHNSTTTIIYSTNLLHFVLLHLLFFFNLISINAFFAGFFLHFIYHHTVYSYLFYWISLSNTCICLFGSSKFSGNNNKHQ